jgi:hypothetical protein
MSFNMTTITMGLLVVAAAAAAVLLSMLVTTRMTTTIPTSVYAQIILNNTNSSSINNNANDNSSSMELQGALAPDHIEALAAQDPEFSAFQEMYDMCLGYTGPIEKIMRLSHTTSVSRQCSNRLTNGANLQHIRKTNVKLQAWNLDY